MLRHDTEQGTTAIFIAAAMLVLLGIAAFAVDYTAALGDRRGNVGAADTAALAGLVLGVTTIDSDALDAAVTEVMDVAAADINEPITPMEWSTCTDPDALAIVSAASPCISFDANYSQIRVVLPDRETPTPFGRLMGVESITTSAAAEAAVNPSLFTTAFPAVAYANASPGDEICITTNVPAASTSPQPHTCGGLPDTHRLSPFDPVPFTGPRACATLQSLIPIAMVNGIDHTFGASGGTGSRLNTCIGGSGMPFPNVLTEHALPSNLLTLGLRGPTGNGRLAQSPGPPLWDFIDDGLSLVTPSCEQVRLIPANPDPDDVEAAEQLLKQCLASHSGVLFREDLLESRRFVVVPKASQSAPTGSAHITAFQPVYLHATYFTHTAPEPPEDGEEPPEEEEIDGCIIGEGFCRHQPGLGPVPAGLGFINSASALVIRCEHLPENACSRAGPSRTYVVKFELVR